MVETKVMMWLYVVAEKSELTISIYIGYIDNILPSNYTYIVAYINNF